MKVLIIGMGNIGRRHLQAASKLDVDIATYDPIKEAYQTMREFIITESLNCHPIEQDSIENALNWIDHETTVIIATTAKGRAGLIDAVSKKEPKAIIAEKPVAQTRQEYDMLLETSTPIYVNLNRRLFPAYKRLRQELEGRSVLISGQYGNIGFACNGIHYIDLACWLTNSKHHTIEYSKVWNMHESKRKGYKDFSADTIIHVGGGQAGNDNLFRLIISDQEYLGSMQITTKDKAWWLIESEEKMITQDNTLNQKNDSKENDNKHEEADNQIKRTVGARKLIEELKIVHPSQGTADVLKDIFCGRKPGLPTIKECEISHHILFEILKKHDMEGLQFT